MSEALTRSDLWILAIWLIVHISGVGFCVMGHITKAKREILKACAEKKGGG